MKTNELNNLAQEYRQSPTEELFSRIYTEAMTKWIRKAPETARYQGIDESELLAAYDDTFIKCLDKFTDNFEHLLNYSLKMKKVELRRNLGIRKKYETLLTTTTDEESDAATLDYLLLKQDKVEDGDFAGTLAEETRLTERTKLIEDLLDKIKDPVTTAIVSEVLSDDTLGKFRPTAIAKKLNVHHSVVTRKLAQLKKYYDSSVFGDYRDYLVG